MPHPYWIVEPESLDTDRVIADLSEIRQYNPQRCEMEQLTAVVFEDASRHICVGYKDLTTEEFWIRGYIPQAPVMPTTLLCDAAMQLANYYALKTSVVYDCWMSSPSNRRAVPRRCTPWRASDHHDTSSENSRYFADLPVPMHD